MRVIKFRAFHKTEKKMYPVAGMLQDIIMLMVSDGCLQGASFSDIELMQYIGENDKNGKPIFEGDLMEAKDYWGEMDYAEVAWNAEQLQWYLKRNGAFYEPLRSPFADGSIAFEVIGNRYETPELLQEGLA